MKTKKNKSSDDKPNPRKSHIKWIISITMIAFTVSVFFTFSAEAVLENSGILLSFIVLLIIIFIGVIFDIVGVAIAAVEEKPFHSMAASRVKGSSESLVLIKNASKVASICCDVIGDICGIISGSSAAFIVLKIGSSYDISNLAILSMTMGGLVAALTIGGKAMGKDLAMKFSKEIIILCGRVISRFKLRK